MTAWLAGGPAAGPARARRPLARGARRDGAPPRRLTAAHARRHVCGRASRAGPRSPRRSTASCARPASGRGQPPPCLRTSSRSSWSSFTSCSWRRRMSSIRRSTLVPGRRARARRRARAGRRRRAGRGRRVRRRRRARRRGLVGDLARLDVAQRLLLRLRVAVVVEDRDELVRLGVDDDGLRDRVGAVRDDRGEVDEPPVDEDRPRLDDAEVARAGRLVAEVDARDRDGLDGLDRPPVAAERRALGHAPDPGAAGRRVGEEDRARGERAAVRLGDGHPLHADPVAPKSTR